MFLSVVVDVVVRIGGVSVLSVGVGVGIGSGSMGMVC
jgi:hypothetical protein